MAKSMKRILFLTFMVASTVVFSLPQDEGTLLLNPKALGAKPPADTERQMRSRFADPPAEYRSMPLWVWNDELD